MWLVSDMENGMESDLLEVFGERTRRVGCEVREHSQISDQAHVLCTL
jgi:hypothetical protein